MLYGLLGLLRLGTCSVSPRTPSGRVSKGSGPADSVAVGLQPEDATGCAAPACGSARWTLGDRGHRGSRGLRPAAHPLPAAGQGDSHVSPSRCRRRLKGRPSLVVGGAARASAWSKPAAGLPAVGRCRQPPAEPSRPGWRGSELAAPPGLKRAGRLPTYPPGDRACAWRVAATGVMGWRAGETSTMAVETAVFLAARRRAGRDRHRVLRHRYPSG